jgi:hypothetical protein
VWGKVRTDFCHRRGLVAQDRRDQVHGRRPREGTVPGQHLVEDDPEREDVRSGVDLAAARLLRRHVGHRAEDLSLSGDRDTALRGHVRDVGVGGRRIDPGEAEVEYLHSAFVGDHDVAGLQVPVDDAAFVRRGQSIGERHGDLEEPGERKAAGRREHVQGASRDELHRQQPHSVRFLDGIDRDDVGVIDGRERPRLAFESGQPLGISGNGIRQDLDRDVTMELRVFRPVHLSHAPSAERREDLVGPQP